MAEAFETPFLWYLNRTSGFVLVGLLAVIALLGVLATASRPQRGVPTFATQLLHRNLSLLAVIMLVIHVSSAVIDTYVDIRWWQAFVPFGATYQPLWLGLGALALNLIAIVVVTSLLRARMRHRPWRLLHLLSYVAVALGGLHGIGIGTDTADPLGWGVLGVVGASTIVGLVGLWRLTHAFAKDAQTSAAGTSP